MDIFPHLYSYVYEISSTHIRNTQPDTLGIFQLTLTFSETWETSCKLDAKLSHTPQQWEALQREARQHPGKETYLVDQLRIVV